MLHIVITVSTPSVLISATHPSELASQQGRRAFQSLMSGGRRGKEKDLIASS